MDQPGYHHTQRGYLHWLLFAIGGGMVGVAVWGLVYQLVTAGRITASEWVVFAILLGVGLLIIGAGLSMTTLCVSADADRLSLIYGPLPLFRASFAFKDIESSEVGRSRVIDGWGIHWLPGRGWTYNLWGFRCVRLRYLGRTFRIGTDDPEGLRDYIADRVHRIQEAHRPSP